MTDFNALLAKIEPSLPNLAHDIEASVPTLTAYGDAAPDLVSTIANTTTVSNTIVDEQSNLDQFLVSAIGLADIGNEVVGGNRQALTDLLHVLVPTTDLLYEYHKSLWCGIGGLVPFAKSPPQFSGIFVSVGPDARRRAVPLPGDLPKVAAKSGGRDYCAELGLPELPPEFRAATDRRRHRLQPSAVRKPGILLNSEGLKNWLFGPLDGPPRNTAQIGMPG